MIPKCKELINNTVIVSSTEPTIDRKKVWLQSSKNMFMNNFATGTTSGITLTKNSNGSITLSNTSTAPLEFNSYSRIKFKSGVTYTISKGVVDAGAVYAVILLDSNGNTIVSMDSSLSYKSFTPTNDIISIRLKIYVPSGVTLNTTLFLQVEQGNTATTYEVYADDKTYILNDNDVYEEFDDIEEFSLTLNDTNATYQAFKRGKVVTIVSDTIRVTSMTGDALNLIGTTPYPPKSRVRCPVTIANGSGVIDSYGSMRFDTDGKIQLIPTITAGTVHVPFFIITYLTD